MPTAIEQKVVAYICRFHQGLWQLLVFDQDKGVRSSETQIPMGSAKNENSLQAALEKAILEESGLEDLMIVSQIDQYEIQSPTSQKATSTECRHVFLVIAPNEERDQWTWHVKGQSTDSTVPCHFHWIPIAQARNLPADLGRSVKSCIQLLFERQESH